MMNLSLLRVISALPLGFLLPGYFISLLLRSRTPWASGFVVSLLVLFHGVFWLGVLGIPVRPGTVAGWLIGASAIAGIAVLWRRPAPAAEAAAPDPRAERLWRLAAQAAGVMGLLLLLRAMMAPLTGYDTYWRWEFLATRLLERERFDFYPPVAPEHYTTYFFAEGLPPLVPFAYWWLYAAQGAAAPALTAILVVAQYAVVMIVTYKIGKILFSPLAGFLAVLTLATSSLFFWSVIMGQETGLTALSVAGMIYFLAAARSGQECGSVVLAGLCAALGALAREYGWAFTACGLVMLLWQRTGVKAVAVFVATALVVAGPWYVRNWWLTGNPLYSNRLLGLPVNEVHAAIIDSYRERMGVASWTARDWWNIGEYLLSRTPLQFVLGPVAALVLWRRCGYLGITAAVVVALWLSSIGYTSGGPRYACRVLSPALVVLSVALAGALDRIRVLWVMKLVGVGFLILYLRAAAYALVYPAPFRAVPVSAWLDAFRQQVLPNQIEEQFRGKLPEVLPPGSRILCENTYLHAALAGTGYDIIPVWSPEVRFLFDPGLALPQIHARLREQGIVAIFYDEKSAITPYLKRYPFFAEGPQTWQRLTAVEGRTPDEHTTILYGLPEP
jgi:hypothetical protein